MENTEQHRILQKMQAVTDALVESGNSRDALRLLIDSIEEFLDEETLGSNGGNGNHMLVDILSNNVLWMARNDIAVKREQEILAAKERSLRSSNNTLLKQNMELRERSMIDDLTGLFNRRYFERSLAYDIERFKRYDRPIGVVLFDVDHFKCINDTFGHSVGDMALLHLSDIAKRMIRSADILARYGGEEFTLLLPETGLEGARITADRLRASVAEMPLEIKQGQIRMTVSCGVTAIEGNFKGNLDDVMGRVDVALYQAKDLGRNTIVVV